MYFGSVFCFVSEKLSLILERTTLWSFLLCNVRNTQLGLYHQRRSKAKVQRAKVECDMQDSCAEVCTRRSEVSLQELVTTWLLGIGVRSLYSLKLLAGSTVLHMFYNSF